MKLKQYASDIEAIFGFRRKVLTYTIAILDLHHVASIQKVSR